MLIALPFYVSYENRIVLKRWSYPFVGVMLCFAALWLAAVVVSWRRGAGSSGSGSRYRRARTVFVDMAFVSWGLAYLFAALDAPENAARLLDFNFFGSVTPAAVLLQWGAMVCLVCAGTALWVEHSGARWANVRLTFLTLAVLFVLGEGAARIAGLVAPKTAGFPTYTSQLWHRRYVQLNAEGYRDVDHPTTRPAHARRLLLIGDSFAFGEGIRRAGDRFGEQLEVRLRTATGRQWEVINASRGDLNTLDELAILRRSLSYRPDVVILLYVFNDIDYLRPLTERSALAAQPGGLVSHLHPLRLLYANSYLFQEGYVRLRLIWRRFDHERSLRDEPYADPPAVREHLKDLARFVATAESAHAMVRIVPFSIAVTLGPNLLRQYEDFAQQAEAFGLPMWRSERAFSGFSFSQLTVNALDAHPNELANRLLAEAMAPRLLQALGDRQRKAGPPGNPLKTDE